MILSTPDGLLQPMRVIDNVQIGERHPIIWDTGASKSVTYDRRDFCSPIRKSDVTVLKGLAAGLKVLGEGEVGWAVTADDGTIFVWRHTAYLVPDAPTRLLSCQSFTQEMYQLYGQRYEYVMRTYHQPQYFRLQADTDPTLGESQQLPTVTCELDPNSNLPVSYATCNNSAEDTKIDTQHINLCVTDEANQNLSQAQKELLKWHFRLGHRNCKSIQMLLRSKALGESPLKRAAGKCQIPKCASCQFGKQRRRPIPTSTEVPIRERQGALSANDLQPGQRVSVDHFVATHKGRLYESYGKTADDKMYSGGCIFVDHASQYIHVEHQIQLNSHETLKSKHKWESLCYEFGVGVQSYQADNGTFSSREYAEDLQNLRQHVRFAGVGAHHQNGIAERAIQTIMSMARTMMIHAQMRWPDTSDLSLWPMAVDYAVFIYNNTPNPTTGIAPIDVITRTRVPRTRLMDTHVWGCPTYVLDPRLQDGKKIPRWQPRSRRGQFLGFSPQHASTIPLVLNLNTHHVSPQYHVVFDDWFATIIGDVQYDENNPPPAWYDLFGNSRFQYVFDDDTDMELADEWLTPNEIAERRARDLSQDIRATHEIMLPDVTAPEPTLQRENATIQVETQTQPNNNEATIPVPIPVPTTQNTIQPTAEQREIPPVPTPTVSTPPVRTIEQPPPQLRRSTRNRQLPERFRPDVSLMRYYEEFENLFGAMDSPPSKQFKETLYNNQLATANLASILPDQKCRSTNFITKHSTKVTTGAYLIKKKDDPDTLMYHEAMADIDRQEWLKAMATEIQQLEEMNCWDVIKRSEAKGRVIPSTWTFRRKRYPDGRMKKCKARFCVRGDQQLEGVDVFDTFAPVVSTSTIRLMLVMSLAYNLHAWCMDFTNAFVHAKREKGDEAYIELPKGFETSNDGDYILRLKRALYGDRSAPKRFYDCLKEAYLKRGFVQSKVDPCLFLRHDAMILCWVDDQVIIVPNKATIKPLLDDLSKDFALTDEGSLENYLGINFLRRNDGTFEATQKGLIDKILSTMGLEDAIPSSTPALLVPLGADLHGKRFQENYSYATVVGMCQYLQMHSRPDITYAVSQCARFTHEPKESHGRALKKIARYLKGTKNNGLIYRPSGELSLDCYCDADFCGLWGVEDPHEPISVRSRSGYVFTLGNCPVHWVSKLQTLTTLSTMEAEYVSLSTAMRELIPMRTIVSEIRETLKLDQKFKVRAHSKVFEDNNGALALAKSPRMTPRSKHIAIHYHFFREQVQNGSIEILPIDTTEQLADIFTKGMPENSFTTIRKLLMGW